MTGALAPGAQSRAEPRLIGAAEVASAQLARGSQRPRAAAP
jgi:hypothetical protein